MSKNLVWAMSIGLAVLGCIGLILTFATSVAIPLFQWAMGG